MENKKFLNICYKFFNRFIIANELIKELRKIDTKSFLYDEKKDFDNLVKEIEKLVKTFPNKEDDFVITKRKSIKEKIQRLEKILKNTKDSAFSFIKEQIDNLKEDYNKEIDSYDRWFAIVDCINNNEYFNNCFENLSDYELLEFIAQNIQAPFPPQLEQTEFDKLVKIGIEKDEREWLWRLAFNYEGKNINFDSIVDYFIEIKDGYYLAELISAVGECINIDNMIDKINDYDLIDDLKGRKGVLESNVSEEQFNKLISKLNL